MEPERIKWNRNSCRFPSEAQSALKPGPTVVRTRKPKFLNRDGYEKPKWVRELGVLSALAMVYKSAKSFFSLSILLIAQLRYQILIFLEMKFMITLVVIAVFKN